MNMIILMLRKDDTNVPCLNFIWEREKFFPHLFGYKTFSFNQEKNHHPKTQYQQIYIPDNFIFISNSNVTATDSSIKCLTNLL